MGTFWIYLGVLCAISSVVWSDMSHNTTMSPNSMAENGTETMGGHNMHGKHNDSQHSPQDNNMHGGHNTRGSHGVFFEASIQAIILFEEWITSTKTELAGACVALGVVSCLYEGLKALRTHLLGVSARKRKASRCARMCSGLHFLQTLLHIIQVAVSYLLMLVVMTFNIWLCTSVVIGAGLGYFLFVWGIDSARKYELEHCN